MKKNQVKIGGVYTAKVSDKLTGVRIMSENPHGGWDAVNLATRKPVRIKSPRRLRGPWNPKGTPTSATGQKKTDAASKQTQKTRKTDTGQRGVKGADTQAKTKRPGGLEAALKVLQEAGGPLSAKTMVKMMLEKGYWQTGGQTPSATIYSAIIREIKDKGPAARFKKVERGKFTPA